MIHLPPTRLLRSSIAHEHFWGHGRVSAIYLMCSPEGSTTEAEIELQVTRPSLAVNRNRRKRQHRLSRG